MASRKGSGALSLAHIVDPKAPDVSSRVSSAGAALLESAMKGESVADASAGSGTAESRSHSATSVVEPESGVPLESVLFDLDYEYGVGGAAYPVYTPVVLLSDGTACKCLESAPEDIDLDRVRRDSPNRVGTWRKSGADYQVRWAGDAKPVVLKSDVGSPRELPGESALRGTYQRLSGGGNTVFGGSVLVAAARNLTFLADGRFSQSNTTAGSSEAATAWSKRGTSGNWSLEGPALTLRYGNGDNVRTSIFYSAKRKANASFGRYGVLWIGGEGYKRID